MIETTIRTYYILYVSQTDDTFMHLTKLPVILGSKQPKN